MASEPLRAGENGVVVRHHADQRRLLAKVPGVDRSQTADDAVTRRVADQVVDISTAEVRSKRLSRTLHTTLTRACLLHSFSRGVPT